MKQRFLAYARLFKNILFGEAEISLIPFMRDNNKNFLDIGANNGIYSHYAMRYFKKVYAIEAHPQLAAKLQALLTPNGHVFATGVSDRAGEACLYVPQQMGNSVTSRSSLEEAANPGFDLNEIVIPITTVDKLGLTDIAVIKVDVEGHELSVLRGAKQTLQSQRPVCIVECEERHGKGGTSRLFDFFSEIGYRSYYILGNNIFPSSDFDIDRMQDISKSKKVKERKSKYYINNFIFAHPENFQAIENIMKRYPLVN